ncbi:MAG: hypothetical protein WBX18_05110 [Terracidiphilus sp.]
MVAPLSNHLGKRFIVLVVALLVFPSLRVAAQDTPLLSGGAAFLTATRGGSTTYLPIIEPLLAVPIGSRLLVESRAALLEDFFPNGGGQLGYNHSHSVALTYLQGDFLASPHATLVAGSFLLPFNTYKERLSPVWIGNFQDGPTVASLGLLSTGSGVGAELRGSAVSTSDYSIDYAAWFSARSSNHQFKSERSSGGRIALYLPRSRFEAGVSYDRSLQDTEESFFGAHLWWATKGSAFRLRSEFGVSRNDAGYWLEADLRTLKYGDTWRGRFEPVFRMNQTVRRDTLVGDADLPLVNTQRADFGLDYNLPHNTRILTSYSRQFSPSGNENIWETGIVYRILFPAWKGKSQ